MSLDRLEPAVLAACESLFELAETIDTEWKSKESLEWSEATQLVLRLRNLPAAILDLLPQCKTILNYAETTIDWDGEFVWTWPEVICNELEDSEKLYAYREAGEHWEVYSRTLSGQEEWKGTVETETIAVGLVRLLSGEYSNVLGG